MSHLFGAADLVVPFEKLRMSDVESVGGKNASLGEMISQLPSGVKVPTGFATTAHAFREFLKHDGLTERINARLDALDTEDVRALAEAGDRELLERLALDTKLEPARCGRARPGRCPARRLRRLVELVRQRLWAGRREGRDQ